MKDGEPFDEVSKRLLNGIIQKPPRSRKRFDKMTKEEIWRKRNAGENGKSGEYDDELDFDSDGYNTIENRGGSDSVDPGVVS